jgi:hypothetical protein
MIKLMIGAVVGVTMITVYPDAAEFFVDSGFKDYLVNGAITALENVK